MRAFLGLVLMLSVLGLCGCSDGSSDAPAADAPHPQGWLGDHSAEATASPGYTACSVCHGTDLRGAGGVVSCYLCHTFSTAPPFVVHPASWTNPYVDHRGYAALNGFHECMGCHGAGLRGSQVAPSCFSASVDGRSCHADGPGGVPHALDGSFLDPANHGRAAKGLSPETPNGLLDCQLCHGEAGGPGDNPRFNVGISDINNTGKVTEPGHGCEGCHEINHAHPSAWAGPNDTFHYSVPVVVAQASCSLCHGTNLTEDDGVEVKCLGCHDSVATFTLDCSFCHGYPPDGSPASGINHRNVAAIEFHVECLMCHGMSESADGGGFTATVNYTLFNKATDTLGDHWDGNINMNSGLGYNPVNFGCDAANCHGNTPAFQLSDSELPVVLKPYVGGN